MDARADVFAMGAVLHELLTGRRTSLGDGVDILDAIEAEAYGDPGLRFPDLPDRMRRAVVEALRPMPEARPADGAALRALWVGDAEPLPCVWSPADLQRLRDAIPPAPASLCTSGSTSEATWQATPAETWPVLPPQTSRRRLGRALLAAGVAALGLGAGAWVTTALRTPQPHGVLQVATVRPRTELDPYSPGYTMFDHVEPAVIEALLRVDPEGQPQPLALAGVRRTDPAHVDLDLRPGAWFHPHPCVGPDGHAADAEDLRFSFQEAARREHLSLDGMELTPDGHTLHLTLDTPRVFLEHELTRVLLLPRELEDCSAERLDDLVQPVGTGPFRFVEPAGTTQLSLVWHPRYGVADGEGQPLPRLEGLAFSYVRPQDLPQATIDGAVDLGALPEQVATPEVLAQLDERGIRRVNVQEPPARVVRVLMFLPRSATAPSLDVRRVVLQALDTERVLAAHSEASAYDPISRWLTPHQLGYDPRDVPRPGLAELRRQVEASGHTTPLTIGAFASDAGTVAQIQEQLTEVGLVVQGSRLAGASLAAALEQHLVDAVVVQQTVHDWGADPYPYLDGIMTGFADVGIALPKAEAELAAARAAVSSKARAAHYRRVEGVLLASVPAVPIALSREPEQVNVHVVAPRVQAKGLAEGLDFARMGVDGPGR